MEFLSSFAGVFRAFILPPAGLFLLIAIGLLVEKHYSLSGRVIVRIGLAAFLVLCTPAGADLLVTPLEKLTTALNPKRLPGGLDGAQAIVVLAAGRLQGAPEYGNSHIPDYVALARLRYAAHLQHATGLPILVTGGNRTKDALRESKAASMARALRTDFRTPVAWIEGESETTAENAEFSRRILLANGITKVLLVTDAMHMPRAERVFDDGNLQVVAAPTMFFTLDELDLNAFFPSAEGLRRAYYASYEWFGLLWYRLQAAPAGQTKNAIQDNATANANATMPTDVKEPSK
ncbi:MAG: YdcF family protein [Pseudomonadota bacterium]